MDTSIAVTALVKSMYSAFGATILKNYLFYEVCITYMEMGRNERVAKRFRHYDSDIPAYS